MIARIYRSVRLHVAALVEVAKRWIRRVDKRDFEASPLAHPEMSGWEDDPEDTLRNLPVVRVPDQTATEPVKSGRHSRGSAA